MVCIIIAVMLAVGVIVYISIRQWCPKEMRLGTLAYFEILSGLGGHGIVCAIAFSGTGAIFGILWAIGYPIFLASDTILTHQWFTVGDPHPASDFKVMLTYTLGQLLIALGFLL